MAIEIFIGNISISVVNDYKKIVVVNNS